MVFSRFIWMIVLHVIAIVMTSVGLGIFLQRPDLPFSSSLLMVLLVFESASLIYYLLKIRRDLLKVITSLRNEDPTIQFALDNKDPYFSEIHQGFNDIIRNFRLIRLDKETEHQFFKATVDHIQFGIVAFYQNGEVAIVNQSFLDLFLMEKLEHIDSLLDASDELPEFLKTLSHMEESFKKLHIDNRHRHLIFLASRFVLNSEEITLVSVRDISREIDKNELEAWQKLIRVLKHEILNSISPIKLISSSMISTIGRDENLSSLKELSPEEIENLQTGLKTIHRRATGLSTFVDAYSNLYQLPTPVFESVDFKDLFERTSDLFKEQFSSENIEITIEIQEDLIPVKIDTRLVEQVLINLVKNGIEASNDLQQKFIHLSAKTVDGNLIVAVKDNGIGIQSDQLESIFIPFYSTKEEGNGIGLSFAQHVMRLHNGYLTVSSIPGEGSEFKMVFGHLQD